PLQVGREREGSVVGEDDHGRRARLPDEDTPGGIVVVALLHRNGAGEGTGLVERVEDPRRHAVDGHLVYVPRLHRLDEALTEVEGWSRHLEFEPGVGGRRRAVRGR